MTSDSNRRKAEALLARSELIAAAAAYARAGLHYEAAEAYLGGGDPIGALDSLTRLSSDDPRYREGCVRAIGLAAEHGRLSLALESLLARFLRDGPKNDAEAASLDRLARLYEANGFPENAAEVLRKLAAFRAPSPEAVDRLRGLVAPSADLADLPSLPGSQAQQPKEVPPPAPVKEEGPVFREGVVVGGRYRLEQRIGKGGASIVFRAKDIELGDAVAVKVFSEAAFDTEKDARLRRELMLSRQLTHPNIVRIFETGLAYGFRYVSMELLEGMVLKQRLRGGPLSLAEGLGYLAQACAGLQAAHDLGVVHRDVKPDNCFLVEGGVLKLVDFGLAKVRNTPGLTATGVVAGTPAYMAPEQASDFRAVTPAADLYSLGVVAYEMFVGAPPFAQDDPVGLLLMHRDQPPPPPRTRNPAIPETLERVILRCLEKAPSRRYSSCRELASAIEALRSGAVS